MSFASVTGLNSPRDMRENVPRPCPDSTSPMPPKASRTVQALVCPPLNLDLAPPWPQERVPQVAKQQSSRNVRGSSVSTISTPTLSHSFSSGASSIFNIIFSPRPYEELCTERAYLLQSFRCEEAKRADLMLRYAWVELTLRAGSGGQQKRKLNKHRKTLENRIYASGEQQRSINLRLGDVCMELQSRETWSRAQPSQQDERQYWQSPGSESNTELVAASAPSSLPPLDTSTTLSTPLNGASPTFVPLRFATPLTTEEDTKETVTPPSSSRLEIVYEQDESQHEQSMGFISARHDELSGSRGRMRAQSLPDLRSTYLHESSV